jgi:WD40 repeat protein
VIPENLSLIKEHSRPEIFLSLARVPNSSRLFVGASDGKVYEVDPLAEKPEWKAHEGHTSYVTGLALAGEVLVSGGYDGRLIWRKLDGGEVIRQTENAHNKWIRKLAATPDGKRVVSVADDMICRVWNAADGSLIHKLHGHDETTPNHFPSMLYAAAISADSQRLATADKIGRIVVWDLTNGSKIVTLNAPGFYTWDERQRIHSIGGIRSLAFSPDGQTLVAGGIGRIGNIDHLDGPARVEMFAWEKQEKLHEFSGDGKGLIQHLCYSPDGSWFVGCGGDNGGLIQIYDPAAKKVVRSDKAPMHIHAAALNEDGSKLFAAGHGKMAVWEVA